MRPFLIFVLLACSLLFFGCGHSHSQNDGRLDGDVFIVTEGAENVKLGLVEVRVLPYADTKASIAKTKAHADREIAALQPQLDDARKVLLSAETSYNAAEQNYTAASDAATQAALKDDDSYTVASQREESAITRQYGAHKAVDAAKGAVAKLESQARNLNSGALYFASLPSSVASAKTDADGKFSISLDRNITVVMAASATRRLLDKTENYYWLISVSLDGQPSKRIFLSNDNLATSDSKDSLVHVVE